MIAIPNMDKPKNCAECFYASRCSAVPRWVTTDESIPRGCPLMDIVRCGECKWSKTYYVRADNSTRLCCDNYSGLDKDVDPADFCPYGERRSE